MQVEWDNQKAAANEHNYGVSFSEAMTVLGDPLSLTAFDPDHSVQEDRFITLGHSSNGRLPVLAHTDRSDRIRIISARAAAKRERKDYEDGHLH
jgi:uncharacterized DUF497 family protein